MLQVRGSVPIFWSQIPNLKYLPPCEVGSNDNVHYRAFKLHFGKLLRKHEKMTCVNLVDKKGFQFRIGQKYEEMFTKFKENFKHPQLIHYHWFDYHHECKGMKVQNCAKLMSDIHDQMKDYGWLEFEINKSRLYMIS